MENKVSVIIPVYNVEDYIEECIESILEQTYTNIEVIIIDDGSKDRSYKKIQEIEKKDNRIKSFSRENMGTLYTRIEGAKIATGKYIMYVDSDDYIDKNMIEELVKDSEEADIVRCNYIIKKGRTGIKEACYFKEKTVLERKDFSILYQLYLTTYQYSGICAQLIKKELFNDIVFDKSVNMCEDLYLNLEIILKAKCIMFLPEAFYYYRIRENSVCTSLDKEKIQRRITDSIHIYSKFFDYIKKWNIETEETKKTVAKRVVKEALYQIKNLFFVSYNRKEILNVIQNVLETDEFENVRIHADKKTMSILEKDILEKKYKIFILIANITIKPMHYIKRTIKNYL